MKARSHSMPARIRLRIESLELEAEINDSPSAQALLAELPLEFRMSRWGDEYYGDCGVSAELTPDAREEMAVGEIAYWPPGRALCVFFGPTPASVGDEPRAASPVNPIGRLLDDSGPLMELGPVVTVEVV
jgi:hypothetical protein